MSLLPFFAPVVDWSPANILSDLEAWWDLGDTSTLWQDTAATTQADSTSDPIKRINDKSPNGMDFSNASSSMTLLAGGGGTKADDQNGLSASNAIGETVDLFVVLKTTDAQAIPFSLSTGTTGYFPVIQNGVTTGDIYNSVTSGTPSFFVNGVAISPANRDGVHNAISTGSIVLLEVRNLDITGWANLYFSSYGSPWFFGGDLYEVLAVQTSAMDATLRSNITAYLNDKWSI